MLKPVKNSFVFYFFILDDANNHTDFDLTSLFQLDAEFGLNEFTGQASYYISEKFSSQAKKLIHISKNRFQTLMEDISENLLDSYENNMMEKSAEAEQRFMDLCNEIMLQNGHVEWWAEFLQLKNRINSLNMDEINLKLCENATNAIFMAHLENVKAILEISGIPKKDLVFLYRNCDENRKLTKNLFNMFLRVFGGDNFKDIPFHLDEILEALENYAQPNYLEEISKIEVIHHFQLLFNNNEGHLGLKAVANYAFMFDINWDEILWLLDVRNESLIDGFIEYSNAENTVIAKLGEENVSKTICLHASKIFGDVNHFSALFFMPSLRHDNLTEIDGFDFK